MLMGISLFWTSIKDGNKTIRTKKKKKITKRNFPTAILDTHE